MDDDVAKLREQAERCFRLARAMTDARVMAELKKAGHELEAQAMQIEAERLGDTPPPRPITRP